ncbi:unnamed protein product [Urochloa humidicola]
MMDLQAKDMEEFKADPYLAMLLNCMLWVFYGILVVHPNDILIITINGIGLVIEAGCFTIFFFFLKGMPHHLLPLFRQQEAQEGVLRPGRGDFVHGHRY